MSGRKAFNNVKFGAKYKVLFLGGLVFNVMREEFLEMQEYRDKLEPLMNEHIQDGRWQLEERTVLTKYSFGKDGVMFIHKVTCSGFLTNFT